MGCLSLRSAKSESIINVANYSQHVHKSETHNITGTVHKDNAKA